MKIKHLHFTVLILITFILTTCSKKAEPQSDTAWMEKKNLTMKEIIDSAKADIDRVESFKYTSANSANVNFYGGQKVNTFLLDKKGNAFSSRNREQNFRIDGKMYTRKIGLREEGVIATVISDILDKSTLDENYFERNIPYVKENGVVNIKMLEKCSITTTLSGNTLTIKTTDFDKIDAKDTQYLTDMTVVYTPHKEITHKGTYVKDGKTIVTTYSFIFNPDETVELPQLMKIGDIFSPVK